MNTEPMKPMKAYEQALSLAETLTNYFACPECPNAECNAPLLYCFIIKYHFFIAFAEKAYVTGDFGQRWFEFDK